MGWSLRTNTKAQYLDEGWQKQAYRRYTKTQAGVDHRKCPCLRIQQCNPDLFEFDAKAHGVVGLFDVYVSYSPLMQVIRVAEEAYKHSGL
jgi:hypothetical protein